MATYVNDLRLKEIATGDESGTWGTSTNTNLELIAEAFSFGTEAITTNADTHTTTIADGSTDPGRSIYLKYTGTLDSACTITIGPNTVSKLWFIENGTSGSQNIIISQGSGANVTVPAGEVKAIYSDGAGSGAAMVDAFANLKVSDAAQTNITSLGTLTTLTVDDITINDSTISDAADLTVDVGGDIVLDADGGNVTFKDGGTAIGDFVNSSSDFVIESKVQDKDIIFKGDDGGSGITALTLDMSEAGNASFNGTVTANAGLIADNITIDGTEIDLSSGDLTIDVAGDIILDADGGNVTFKDGGTAIGDLVNSSSDFVIESKVQDKDIVFKGNDGGSEITALTLDMSAAGRVGIGTTSPNQKVDIKGDNGDQLRLDNDGDRFTQLTMANNGTTKASFFFDNTDAMQDLFAGSGNGLRFSTGGSERVRIASGGDFLINKTSASGASEGFEFESNVCRITKSGGTPLFLNRLTSDGVLVDLRKDTVQVGTISTNANSLPSDVNFKRDICDLDLGLNLVTKLKPSQYNYKIDSQDSPKMFGLIAQDLEESLSEVGIEKNSTWLLQHEPNDDEKESDYSLDYSKLIPILIKAIQELEDRIKNLEG
jgi:hypothetical protein